MLNNHSYYSLRYGVLSPQQLVQWAAKEGIQKLALTDINNVSAIPSFVSLCHDHGIDPVAGVDFRRENGGSYVVLAKNNEGFHRINAFLSHHNLNRIPLPPRFPVCEHTHVIYPILSAPSLHHHHEYAGVGPADLHHMGPSPKIHPEKMVALHPISFRHNEDHLLHLHLRAIHHRLMLSQLKPFHHGSVMECLEPTRQTEIRYARLPHLITNAHKLLESCHISFDFGQSKNKPSFTGSMAEDRDLLQKLTIEGMTNRYGEGHQEAKKRIEKELDIIHRMKFSAYFLMTWDIVRYAHSRGFQHVGRGSGANSMVAYCLRITDVDPIALNLYFERFINPKRSSPPDFDLDFSWKDRDEIFQYIFQRHGPGHTALLGTFSTFRRRASIRETAKLYGLPPEEISRLITRPPGYTSTSSLEKRILHISKKLLTLPNLRSIHAGGVLISHQPICCYSALDLPPKGMPVVQWDMHTAEALGFEKIDILSQRGMGHINECLHIIEQRHGYRPNIRQMETITEDESVKTLLRTGETIGCFYVESPAMRGLLKKLQCESYPSLVAASSIIRPGVSRSGMMQEYIRRVRDPAKTQSRHPILDDLLRETHGIMVYQEDVIRVGHHFAGLDLADADILRRAMSGKNLPDHEMEQLSARFFSQCRKKGYPSALSREVWHQIASFAAYSFSKAHSASYAAESFQSLYLKARFPLEFITAVINNGGGFYRRDIYLHEARRLGAHIQLPCVNRSRTACTLHGKTIILGLSFIHSLERNLAIRIVKDKSKNGCYSGLEDFMVRTKASGEQVDLLIRANALRFTNTPKSHLLWQAKLLGKQSQNTWTLFDPPPTEFRFPRPETSALTHAWDEIELFGFPVSMHIFQMLPSSCRDGVTARNMKEYKGTQIEITGWIVAVKPVRTARGEIMYFGCFIDPKGVFFDTVHFPVSAKKWPFTGNQTYRLKGKPVEDFGLISLEVEQMQPLPLKADPRRQ